MARKRLSRVYPLVAVAMVLVMGLPSCGGGTTTPNPPPSTTPPSPGRITVTQPSTAQLCFSPLAQFFFRLRIPVRFQETGGTGVNVNYVRLTFLRGATEVERREVTATALQAIAAQRVNASATVNATIGFDFNADPDTWDTLRIEFNFTDDRGNTSSTSWPDVTDLVLSLPNCTI